MYLDGKALAAQRRALLVQRLQQLKSEKNTIPGLAVILASPDPASRLYVKAKQRACQSVGIKSFVYEFKKATQSELQDKINQLNHDPQVHGVLVQLPLLPGINVREVLDSVAPHKDVDALSTHSLGQLLTHQAVATVQPSTSPASTSQAAALQSAALCPQQNTVKPCTPMGILTLLQQYKINLQGARVCVVGRSFLVGQPTALLLQAQGATVTVCHSGTRDLRAHTLVSDIVVVAAGHKHLLARPDFKRDAVVVDVGIHRHGAGVTGDVNPRDLNTWLKALSPVPGGVGPMTVAMLLENTYALACRAP